MIRRLNNALEDEEAQNVLLQEQLQQERDKTKKLSKFVELSGINLFSLSFFLLYSASEEGYKFRK
jgi:hypothetical protein